MLVALVAVLASHSAGVSQGQLASMGLVPRPKHVQLRGSATIGPGFRIVSSLPSPSPADWLAQVLQDTFGWSPSNSGTRIRYVRRQLENGPEAYRLEVSPGEVTIVYTAPPGAFRATATLIRILTSYAAVFDGQRLTVPAVRISDWPDMALRGVHLQMAFSVNERLARDTIEAMARLGYNAVGIEVGGRFEYRSHPECAVKPYWTREQIRGLVALAKSRGMTPIPCINSIDHTERSPHVFVIDHPSWQRRVMDLTNPRFYQVFFDLLDELIDAFDHPPYLHLGADECHYAMRELVKQRGGSADAYFAQFVNRTTEHLKKRGVRVVIWHDMLLRRGEYPGEPANAFDDVPTDRALSALTDQVIIDFWCYHPAPFAGLKLFRQRGFDVWVSPWHHRRGVAELCQAGYRLGASGVLGTTWTDASRAADGIVLTADHSWNASLENDLSHYDAWAVANRLYCGRSQWTSGAAARPIKLSGGQALPEETQTSLKQAGAPIGRQALLSGVRFDFSMPLALRGGRFRELSTPQEILDAAAKGQKIFVLTPAGLHWPVDGVNRGRGRAETIVYVRTDQWQSTKTNQWGREWVVSGGRVAEVRDGGKVGGNAPIPHDGYVISAHGWHAPSGYAFLTRYLHTGDRVRLVVAELPSGPQSISASIDDARAVAIVMNAIVGHPPFGEELLATVAVETSSGKRYAFECRSSLDLPAISQPRWLYAPLRGAGWRLWPAWSANSYDTPMTLMAYEWHAPAGEVVKRIEITATPIGRLYGVAVLAASAWQ